MRILNRRYKEEVFVKKCGLGTHLSTYCLLFILGSFCTPALLARTKCKYVLNNSLRGAMFWDYAPDPTGVLPDTIDTVLWRNSSTAGNQK